MSNDFLKKEDYEEPCCVLKKPGTVTPVPMGRVIEKLDDYLDHQQFDEAIRHLKYWISEAQAGNDERGELLIVNEQIGLYRKLDKKEEAIEAAERALAFAKQIGMDGTVTMGTTLVNAATAFKAFGQAERALPLYKKARGLYESMLEKDDSRLGGLYNNMALTVMDLKDYDGAEKLYKQALEVMERIPGSECEQAITWCNLADLEECRAGDDGPSDKLISECLDKAKILLDSDKLKHDGYYAFVCDKCAPCFGYHGYFVYEKELKNRVEAIRERT